MLSQVKRSGSRKFSRNHKGSSLLEALFSLMIMIPLTLSGIDLIIVIFVNFVNVNLCQQAARAASLGAPSICEAGAPRMRAMKSLDKYMRSGGLLMVLPDVEVSERTTLPADIDVFGGQASGQVTVKITSRVTPPFFLKSIMNRSSIDLTASQTYPFTWTFSRKAAVL